MPEVIFEDRERRLVLQRSRTCPPQFVEFLEQIVWGSGGVQYTMPDLAPTLNRFKSPNFFSLTEQGRLVGATTLNQKTVDLNGKSYPAFYAYGIAVDAAKRGLGYGTLLAEHRLRYGLSRVGEKGLIYNYIEATNLSSLKTSAKVGSQSIGLYEVLLTSRWRPRDDARFRRINAARREPLIQLLRDQYAGHALLDLDQSVDLDNYYILEQGGQIVAGLQVDRHRLNLRHLSGAAGQLILLLLPHLPFLRRLLPKGSLSFLRFGNICAASGMEAAVFHLMEALLARHHLHFGMTYLDRRSPVALRLKAVGRFGLFQALIDVPVHVMAFLQGFSAGETADLLRQPLFISMQDPV